MSQVNLMLVAEGLNTFLMDIDQTMAKNPALEQKIFDTVKPHEMEAFLAFAETISKVGIEDFQTDNTIRMQIKAMEMTTEIFQRAMPQSEIVKSIPPELRNQECADLLNGLGAKNLADLCAFNDNKKPGASKKQTSKFGKTG